MRAGRERELSNDQLVALLLAVVALGLLWVKRRLVLAAVGRWLQNHQILLTPGQGLFIIPFLGSVDVARLLAALAVTGLATLPTVLWLRHRLAVRGPSQGRGVVKQRSGWDDPD